MINDQNHQISFPHRHRSFCENIYTKLAEIQDHLKEYGIKKKDIEQLRQYIDTFDKVIVKPITVIKCRTTSTKFLSKGIDDAGVVLKKGLDRMIPLYESFPEFRKAYAKARVQVKYKNGKIALPRRIKAFNEAPVLPMQRKRKQVLVEVDEIW